MTTPAKGREIKERISKCLIREGVGLCDQCGLPKWPQQYAGYGHMLCLDCINELDQLYPGLKDEK